MNNTSRFTEDEAIQKLSKKPDCKIRGREILVNRENTTVGNKSWGMIDFLLGKGTYDCFLIHPQDFRNA